MATYKIHRMYNEEDERRKRMDAAEEEIRLARKKLAKMEEKYAELDEEEVDITEKAENILGFVMLIGLGVLVLYRYLTYGFI